MSMAIVATSGLRRSGSGRFGVFLLLLFATFCGLWVYVFPSSNPPKEAKLLEAVRKNRAGYEQLRTMLLADDQVRAISARSGVETTESGLPRPPDQVKFSVSRYNEYRSLLQQINSPEVFREVKNTVCISMWASGFAGDTRHVNCCWLEQAPANLVSSLDDFYKTPKPRRPVFRHVDGNWYLWADW
jgi:hypothetical protein